jgi:hypothetical protein
MSSTRYVLVDNQSKSSIDLVNSKNHTSIDTTPWYHVILGSGILAKHKHSRRIRPFNPNQNVDKYGECSCITDI